MVKNIFKNQYIFLFLSKILIYNLPLGEHILDIPRPNLDQDWGYLNWAEMTTRWERVFFKKRDWISTASQLGKANWSTDAPLLWPGMVGYLIRESVFNTPWPYIDQEVGNLNREEQATGWERVFLALLVWKSIGLGEPVDRFPNRLNQLRAPSTRSTILPKTLSFSVLLFCNT